MIPRPFTCCCAVLAIASGFFLYTKKHQTTLLDQQISQIVKETEHVRTQTSILRTEWALENQPERLAQLVARHEAGLHTMDPTQFVRMADLEGHLPAVVKDAQPPAPAALVADKAAGVAPPPVIAPPAHAPAPAVVADARPAHNTPAAVSHPARPVAVPALVADVPHAAAEPAPHPHAASVADAIPVLHAPVVHHDHPHAAPEPAVAPVRVAQTTEPTALSRPAHRVVTETPRPQVVASTNVDDDAPAAPIRHSLSHTTTPAIRHVAQATDDEAAPIRHPLPVAAASWHATRPHRTSPTPSSYMEARATSGYSSGSLLSRGGDALPAPVPVAN
ncbi:hypothetical protein CSR02_01855 [Acetobacter pomorum]|uniref:Uncharacterized protein n=1 Tax=Acetobacter pomorum TaxID=65959 RepID=A0A2G4RFK8_9PROT|nr:hypothetical protein [Acetobacter pomorum]PHY95328.1 hypothetical protein CSR02_01855 [Acetobacter pomorum]